MNLKSPKSRSSSPVADGILSSVIVVFIWSGWIVVSRYGAQSPLTIYDMAAIRFGVSGLISLPIVWYFKPWKTLASYRILVLALLAGLPYQLMIYLGFELAPAAHSGVFMNGLLPAFTIGLSYFWLSNVPNLYQFIGLLLILIGALASLGESFNLLEGAWRGDLLFATSALLYSVFLVLVKRWEITTPQILMCVMVVNGFIFVPVWFAVLPSAIAETSVHQILLQVLFQGVLATLIGLVLVARATVKIGAPAVASIMSGVPGLAALLALLFLNEKIGITGWFSIAILTFGILMVVMPDLSSNRDK